jgi:hypothetical protein
MGSAIYCCVFWKGRPSSSNGGQCCRVMTHNRIGNPDVLIKILPAERSSTDTELYRSELFHRCGSKPGIEMNWKRVRRAIEQTKPNLAVSHVCLRGNEFRIVHGMCSKHRREYPRFFGPFQGFIRKSCAQRQDRQCIEPPEAGCLHGKVNHSLTLIWPGQYAPSSGLVEAGEEARIAKRSGSAWSCDSASSLARSSAHTDRRTGQPVPYSSPHRHCGGNISFISGPKNSTPNPPQAA